MAWHQKVPANGWYWTRVTASLNLDKACLRFIGYQQFRLITWPLSPLPHRNVWISVRQVPTGVSSALELMTGVCWTSYRNSVLRFSALCGHKCACVFHYGPWIASVLLEILRWSRQVQVQHAWPSWEGYNIFFPLVPYLKTWHKRCRHNLYSSQWTISNEHPYVVIP